MGGRSARQDGEDVFSKAEEHGWTVALLVGGIVSCSYSLLLSVCVCVIMLRVLCYLHSYQLGLGCLAMFCCVVLLLILIGRGMVSYNALCVLLLVGLIDRGRVSYNVLCVVLLFISCSSNQ